MRWGLAVTWVLLGVMRVQGGGGYVGPGACASPSCHGSPTPRADHAVTTQNEYGIWRTEDRHAQAWTVLRTERAGRMMTVLGLPGSAASAPRCLACHATPDLRDAAHRRDGVTCEACHGPAEGWIARHTERSWTHTDSLARGMIDLRTPAVAAARCLDCHLGRGPDTVDHDLLAAGHPLLGFELETYASNLPAHWVPHDANREWFDGRAWVAGQAAVVMRGVSQAPQSRAASGWPDFAAYDCSACHHEINRDPNWPLAGAGERPAVDRWLTTTLAPLITVLLPEQASALQAAITSFEDDDDGAIGLSTIARALAARARAPIAPAAFAAIGRHLAATPPRGFRSAQQLAWGLDALAVAEGDATDRAPVRIAIARLFPCLHAVQTFDPGTFSAALADVRTRWR